MVPNNYGKIVIEEWYKSEIIRDEIELDEFVLMPNHIHGILSIGRRGDRSVAQSHTPGPKPKSLSSFIAGFKSTVTKQINSIRNRPGVPVWQRNYYEHIVRNEDDLLHAREYIANNPMEWESEKGDLPDRPYNYQ